MRLTRARKTAAAVFVGTLLVAIVSPLEGASHDWLSAHMVQHVLLFGVAAPALALSLPPAHISTRRWYFHAALALVVSSVVLLGWHAPVLFDAALRSDPVHGLEHVTMTAAAAYLWWVLAVTRPHRGESVVVLFVATLPLTVLGVGLLLASSPWYEAYPDVVDQQVGGAVMWGVGSAVAVAQGVALFVVWIRSADADRSGSAASQHVTAGGADGSGRRGHHGADLGQPARVDS